MASVIDQKNVPALPCPCSLFPHSCTLDGPCDSLWPCGRREPLPTAGDLVQEKRDGGFLTSLPALAAAPQAPAPRALKTLFPVWPIAWKVMSEAAFPERGGRDGDLCE